MKTYRQFVADQVQRGEALPPTMGYIYSEPAQIEICNFFESRTSERREAEKQSTLRWLEESSSARMVKAAMDEIMQGEQAPTIASVRATWEHLYNKPRNLNPDCPDCNRTGWQIVAIGDTEAARRCPRGCVAPPDKAQAAGSGARADSEANTVWAELVGGEIAAKLAKPIAPKREPPPLKNPITEADLAQVEKFKQ